MVARPIEQPDLAPVEEPIAIPSFSAPLGAVVALARTAGLALPKGSPALPMLGHLRLGVANGLLRIAATG
jgi:hypothetical protein